MVFRGSRGTLTKTGKKRKELCEAHGIRSRYTAVTVPGEHRYPFLPLIPRLGPWHVEIIMPIIMYEGLGEMIQLGKCLT